MLRRRSLLALLTSQALVACGGANTDPNTPQGGTEPDGVAPVPPPAPDAHERAIAATGAKIYGTLHVERIRNHPLAPQLIEMASQETKVLEGTGIEPLQDVDRVFVAAKSAKDPEAVMAVLEHHVEADRLKTAMQTMVDESGEEGRWVEGEPYPTAIVYVEKRHSLVAAVTPTMLVITSPAMKDKVKTLAGTSGIPEPTGEEALSAYVSEPRATLENPKGTPPIPATVAYAEGTITFQANGDADVHIEGKSANPAQARDDAKEINDALIEATSAKMGPVRVQVVKPITFAAEGDMLKGDRKVTLAEMQTIVSLAGMANKSKEQ